MDSRSDVSAPDPTVRKRSAQEAIVSPVSAILLSLLFLVSGFWKLLDPIANAERMTQMLFPAVISMPLGLIVGVCESLAGIMLLIPRFRRWGAILAGLLLLAFMAYIGIFYTRLVGEDCSCFPWVERFVGPAFFASDAAMLAVAVLAGWWVKPSRGLRSAGMIAAGLAVFAIASLGFATFRQSGIQAPPTVVADGQTVSLRDGNILLYFFDPECTHCEAVAREMSKQNWADTKIISLPTAVPQFAQDFLQSCGLKAALSYDAEALRTTFVFVESPYAVALVNGRQKAAFNSGQLASDEYYVALRELGFIR